MAARNTYQLLVDYDFKIPLLKRLQLKLFESNMKKTLSFLQDECYITTKNILKVPSKHGMHYYITVQTRYNLKPEHLLLIQSLLGDDKNRCIFNLNRLLLGWPWKANNILFQENEIH